MSKVWLHDPNMLERLATELQLRIGQLPRIDVHTFNLTTHPGQIVRNLHSKPRSFSELSRLVRASRTLKLPIRALGHMTGGELDIYAKSPSVIVDCSQLTDEPRMQLVSVDVVTPILNHDSDCGSQGLLEEEEEYMIETFPGIRVLAGVTMDELVSFMVNNRVELRQSVDSFTLTPTVVGSVVAGSFGVVGSSKSREVESPGGSFADQILALRAVDAFGDLIEYSKPDEVLIASATLGLVGIVYDVTLRCHPMTMSKVSHSFHQWSELLEDDLTILSKSIANNTLTQIIYLPYNGCNFYYQPYGEPLEDGQIHSNLSVVSSGLASSVNMSTATTASSVRIDPANDNIIDSVARMVESDETDEYNHLSYNLADWKAINDQICLRTVQRITDPKLNADLMQSPRPRKFLHILDPVYGPKPHHVSRASQLVDQDINLTPFLLWKAHQHLRRRYIVEPTLLQYTPWAFNSLGKIEGDCRSLAFTMETDSEMKEFAEAMKIVLGVFHEFVGSTLTPNYAFNLGLRIDFTSMSTANRLWGVGFKQPSDGPPHTGQRLLAHFTFTGLLPMYSSVRWSQAAARTTSVMTTQIPRCNVQWKSEWYGVKVILNRVREEYAKSKSNGPVVKLIERVDRDGVFMNETLEDLLYPTVPTEYHGRYRIEREDLFISI